MLPSFEILCNITPQMEWYNSYSLLVREKVGLRLQDQGKTRAYSWLLARTQLIPG